MYKKIICSLLSPFALFANPFVDSLNTTSMNLFYLYGESGYNRVYSPFATHSALLALYCGAAGESEKNLRSLYGFSLSQNMVPIAYDELYKKIEASCFLLNSFWTSGQTPLTVKYQDLLYHSFKTQIQGVNLSNLPQTARNINSFAITKLASQIQPFVSITAPFSLLSVNGLAYSLEWQSPFLTKYSTNQLFYPKSGETPTPTHMMSRIEKLPYYEDASFQVVALPLKRKNFNNRLQFLIYLPKEHISDDPFALAYSQMPHVLQIPSLLKLTHLHLQLPSFDFQMNASLTNILTSSQIANELTSSANFSLISRKTALFLSDMITSTRILVNEYGLGVTSGHDDESLTTILENKEKAVIFNTNRPFMYLVHDMDDNLILTIGSYSSPTIAAPPPPPKIKPIIVPPPPPPPPPPADTPYPQPQPVTPVTPNNDGD